MKEKRNVWFGFIGSFNPKFYREISHQSFGRSFGYLTLLLLVMSLSLSIKYTFDIRGWIQKGVEWVNTDFSKKLPEFLPEINIIDGELSSPMKQPLIHEWENEFNPNLETEKFAFILDTTGAVTSLDGYPNGILITKHKLVIKYRENMRSKLEEYEFSDIKYFRMSPSDTEGALIDLTFEGEKFTLTKEHVIRWSKTIEKAVFPILLVSLWLGYLFAKLFHLFFFSILSAIVNKVSGANLSYSNLLNIGVFAMTPPVTFALLAALSGIRIPLIGLIYIGLYCAFLVMGITQSKTIVSSEEGNQIC